MISSCTDGENKRGITIKGKVLGKMTNQVGFEWMRPEKVNCFHQFF